MKSFKDVTILIMDGTPDKQGDFFDHTSIISYATPTIYILDQPKAGSPIGEVKNIRDYAARLVADLEFYADLNSMEMEQIPTFAGKCIKRVANHILEARLDTVDLSLFNSDPRIPKLNYYVNDPYNPSDAVDNINITITIPAIECHCESLIYGHSDGCPWKK